MNRLGTTLDEIWVKKAAHPEERAAQSENFSNYTMVLTPQRTFACGSASATNVSIPSLVSA
jgi:hypothetical protein